ncbi:hypothetical protein E0H50_18900 [Kribbella sindirgiensis]|uniref:Uncharacterized protein n=1 Tax=Kribbella sindirgiensis TaxID=1124744 RepID=A0A4R0II23_9ACTN|nr:hypothetical protein E0H50_18900 [Kribbella sindirgiensis]
MAEVSASAALAASDCASPAAVESPAPDSAPTTAESPDAGPEPDPVSSTAGAEAWLVGADSSGADLRRRRRQKPRGLGVDWAMRFASSWAG